MPASSVGSTASSVNFRGGTEIDLESALDELIVEIQQNLNMTQCAVREIGTLMEGDEDFMEAIKIESEVHDKIDIITDLFVEIKDITSQVRGKCPNEPELKAWFADWKTKRKEEVKRLKDERKAMFKQWQAEAKQEEKKRMGDIKE